MHRDQRAERVAVGVLVRDEQEALAVADLVEAPARATARRVGRARRGHRVRPSAALRRCSWPRSAARAARRCRRARSCSSGVRFRRSSLATRAAGSRGRSAGPSSEACARVAVAEHAHEHAGVAQVGAGLDVGHGHESDAGVLEILGHGVAEDLADGLVDPAHPRRRLILVPPGPRTRPGCARRARLSGKRSSSQRSTRSAARVELRAASRWSARPPASRAARCPGASTSATAAPRRPCSCAFTDCSVLALGLQAPGLAGSAGGRAAARRRRSSRVSRRARARPAASRRPPGRRLP